MQIVLIRHGKPDVPEHGKLSAAEIPQWVESYNSAGIVTQHKPSKQAIEVAGRCNTVVCSNLPRSIESAHALGVKEIDFIEAIFREIELPYGSFPSPKLSPNFWVILFRLLCFFGYSSNGESLREGKLRAAKGARKLEEIAENGGSVLFVGHGFVNKLIAKALLSKGWQGPMNPGKQFPN